MSVIPTKRKLTLVIDPEPAPREPRGWGDSYILWLEDECARLAAEVGRLCKERTSRC